MKKHIPLVLAALAVASPALAQAPKDSAIVGMPIEPPNLDPTSAAPVAIREVTYANVYEGLVRIDRNGRTQPWLAESWTVSDDGLTFTFKLKSGVKFHDGSAFDSADVKFSFERAKAPDSTNAQKQIFAPIASIETPDPATVVIKLSQPSGNFLYYLGWGDAAIVAPETAANNKTNPVGTGPFKFKEWVRGDRVELVKNADYRDAAKIKLNRVVFRFIADAQAQIAALKAGDIDAFPAISAPELFDQLRKDAKFTAKAGNTEGEIIAGMNNTRKPLSDVRVRRALMHAIDRKTLIEGAYSGFGQPIGSHFSPNHPAYVDTTGMVPYDPAKAKALLAEAGFPNGLELTIKTPQMAYASRSAEVLSAMLAEVGVKLKIEPTEFPAKWIDQVFKNTDYDMTIVAHTEPQDIGIYARDKYYFNYASDKLKSILAEADKTIDEAKRYGLYGDAQKLLAEDVPALFLFQLPKLGVWNAKLEGMWENYPIPANDMTEVSWKN